MSQDIPVPKIWIEQSIKTAQSILNMYVANSLADLPGNERSTILYFATQISALKILLEKYDTNNSVKGNHNRRLAAED